MTERKRIPRINCVFCGVPARESRGRFVAGVSAGICAECVALCVELFLKQGVKPKRKEAKP